MLKNELLLIIFSLFNGIGFTEDSSTLSIYANSNSRNILIQIILTDPLDRKG